MSEHLCEEKTPKNFPAQSAEVRFKLTAAALPGQLRSALPPRDRDRAGTPAAVGPSSRPARVEQPRPSKTPAIRGDPKIATLSPAGQLTIGATSRLVLAIATAVKVLALKILHDAGRKSGPGSHGSGPPNATQPSLALPPPPPHNAPRRPEAHAKPHGRRRVGPRRSPSALTPPAPSWPRAAFRYFRSFLGEGMPSSVRRRRGVKGIGLGRNEWEREARVRGAEPVGSPARGWPGRGGRCGVRTRGGRAQPRGRGHSPQDTLPSSDSQ